MLNTLKNQLVSHRANITFETMCLDAQERSEVRDVMLEEMGSFDIRDDIDYTDNDLDELISSIPESDLDDDCHLIDNGMIKTLNYAGNEQEISIDECCERYIPMTEEVA